MEDDNKKFVAFLITVIIILAAFVVVIYYLEEYKKEEEIVEGKPVLPEGVKLIKKSFVFSTPEIEENKGLAIINVEETDFHSMGDGRPTIPVNLTTMMFPFGTKITKLEYDYSTPEIISIPNMLSYGSCSTLTQEGDVYDKSEMYPSSFVTYHTGGGLSKNEHKTFLNIRVYPVTYIPANNELHYVNEVEVKVYYMEPETPLLEEKNEFDLLIISPNEFSKNLQSLVNHKENKGIKTKLVTVEEIREEKLGRDDAEKIKYYIKKSIEESGINSVLLFGGLDGQSTSWNLPARYSHVLIREGTQENPEPSFLSDLYFADIYDSEGNFSSWDTNSNEVYGEFEVITIDEMDLYPDVHLGRLPCRNKREARTMIDKIINYENSGAGDWFKNMVLVSGDHWPDEDQISEGILIMEKTKELMSDFNPVELYATEDKLLLVGDINKAINQGAGFAYFCGHGNPTLWGIHYPPDAKGWGPSLGKLNKIPFYHSFYTKLLRNKNKLPITLVGGCNNGQFDVSIGKSREKGKIKFITGCWAWKLTVEKGGGGIATIANTALGTHAMGDADNDGVNDYLEVYDGWLELKFFEMYSQKESNILGQLHQEAMTRYLNTFLGNLDEMDTKMVQQWELFGDPSLEVK